MNSFGVVIFWRILSGFELSIGDPERVGTVDFFQFTMRRREATAWRASE